MASFSTSLFRIWGCLLSASLCGLPESVPAQSVQEPTTDPSPAAEQATFQLHEDFEVNLFADETLGIANPIAIHWDAQGRLWVLTTLAYAQLGPGEKPDDKLFILEDTDADGKADKASIYADGLDMPTGFALGLGGVYLGEGSDLIFLRDTDGDGRADLREVVLSGFGFGDTHQNISNLTWGPDGRLYFTQGLHTFSRIETPWGIVRGDTAGFWRFDPHTLKLEPFGFPSLVSQNPCGVSFDPQGNLFIKSNNRELIFATPSLVPTSHQLNLVPVASIGVTPGKSMGGEYVKSGHLPDWIQNHILIAGYYSHRVTAFPLVKDGAGFARVDPVEVLVSSHESFRPVDIRIGPDGAIYVADWFNPIIGHYQASLRHPDRDKSHGRIWRITAKGKSPAVNFLPLPVSWTPNEGPGITRSSPPRDFSGLDANEVLHAVVEWSNLSTPDSLKIALRALDHEPDRFIKYALTQATHALADQWLPALKSGDLAFDRPEHLAFALEALGGGESTTIARNLLSQDDLSPAVRARFAGVLARVGNPSDLRNLLDRAQADEEVLEALVDSWAIRQQRPAPPFAPRLGQLIASESPGIRAAAIMLAGLWQVKPLTESIRELADDTEQPHGVRTAAFHSLARIQGKESVAPLEAIAATTEAPLPVRRGAIEALALVDLKSAARATSTIFMSEESVDSESLNGFLIPFLNRKGGAEILAESLGSVKLNPERAQTLILSLSTMGHGGTPLSAVLNESLGVPVSALPYSPDFVTKLAAEVRKSGDAKAGQLVYQRAQLTCVACHQIGGVGGILGPNLDTVGAGLPLDLIIESVIWPDRQLKEGYFALTITTKSGEVVTGYEEKQSEGILWLRDTATGKTKPVPPGQIAERKNIGTLMPAGLTNSLKREELRDLVAYLANLKGSQ